MGSVAEEVDGDLVHTGYCSERPLYVALTGGAAHAGDR